MPNERSTYQSSSRLLHSRLNNVRLNFVQRYNCNSSPKSTVLKELFSSIFGVYNNIIQLPTSSNLKKEKKQSDFRQIKIQKCALCNDKIPNLPPRLSLSSYLLLLLVLRPHLSPLIGQSFSQDHGM